MMVGSKCDLLLLADIKNYLDITWSDNELDAKLTGIAEAGICKINALTGGTADYHAESEYKALLLDYCRLRYAAVPEKFDELHKADLIRLRLSAIACEVGNDA